MKFISRNYRSILQISGLIFGFLFLIMNTIFPLRLFSYAVAGRSMAPSLPEGSLVYVKKENTYNRGDVVTFKTKTNHVLTHRIVDSENDIFITQGDANAVSDTEVIKKEQVLGKTFLTIPYIGAIILEMKKVTGIS